MGRPDRAGQGDRHRQIVRRRLEHARLVLWLDQCRQHQPADRRGLWPRFSEHHNPRHRRRAESLARRSWRPPSGRGRRSLLWRLPGVSMGGRLPRFMDAIVPVNTAPWASVNTDKQLAELQARLASDPDWHGGRYYGKAACKTVLTDIRVETLKRYGIETALAPRLPDPVAREAAIRDQAANWAAKWDANSLIILRRALLGFDTRPDFARIKAKVLYILCRTDALFPPKIAPDVIKALTAAGVEARYFELDSDLGHSSSGPEHAKWSPVLREFLAPLVARLN